MSDQGQFFDVKKPKSRAELEKIIFVEGNDDAFFIDTLLFDINADPKKIGIVIVGGNEGFEKALKSFLDSSPVIAKQNKGYAIIIDADDSCEKAANKIAAILKSFDQPIPEAGKIVIPNPDQKIGLYIFPDNKKNGNLEELCLNTIAGTSKGQAAEEFLSVAEKSEGIIYDNLAKRKVQVYLAAFQYHLCRGAGNGFKKGAFIKDHIALNELKTFIKNFIS